MRFDEEFNDFYEKCLTELRSRPNWSESFIPILDRYVTITATLSKLNHEILDAEIIVEHTNKASHKNQATSPKWRMFLQLNAEAIKLAAELKLTPKSAPIREAGGKKKGFDLSMTVNKSA